MEDNQSHPLVLLVDDEPEVTRSLRIAFRKEPFEVHTADSAQAALELLESKNFDVIVSDERMPGMSGSELLTRARTRWPDTARIILSGQATLEAAVQAINGADIYRFLMKPCPPAEVASTIRGALRHREEQQSFQDWREEQSELPPEERRANLEEAIDAVHLVFQPIVDAKNRNRYAFETLMRCETPGYNNPELLLAAARREGMSTDLCDRVLAELASQIERIPTTTNLFVNLEASSFMRTKQLGEGSALAGDAGRLVLEITERESIEDHDAMLDKMASLRKLGYRIALDDLGAGQAGLSNFALLAPDVVKLDMDLVREVQHSPTKQRLIAAMAQACTDLDILLVAEGIENEDEASWITQLGCDLLQGYHFGKPASLDATEGLSQAA